MNEKPETKIEYISPLKKICMTIGELPTAYIETMSYYEMLVWFVEFLKNKVIPTIDNNALAVQELQTLFIELQNYVNNYFDNLDVQEEINNKLDEMEEDGTLDQIIEQYLNSSAIWGFDTVADMKEATNLIDGSYARTLGYYTINDGGEATYKIRKITNQDEVDEGSIIALNDKNLIAELIINRTEINAAQFGIKGDGIYDDSIGIQKAIDYACSLVQNKTSSVSAFGGIVSVILPAKKLYIKTQINCSEVINIIGENTETSLILNDNINYMLYINKNTNSHTTNEETHLEGGLISNIKFDGNSRGYTCTSALGLKWIDHMIIEKLYFYGIKGKCIELQGVRESNFNEIFTRFCGIYESGCIEIIENDGGDSSNLNYGNDWNIIFPFGNAIKFNAGEFQNINNIIIHGMFQNIINSLESYFGTNEYQDTDNNFIELNNSNLTLSNAECIYAPDKSAYINSTTSNIKLMNTHFGAHKSTQETHNGNGKFIILSTNSILNIYSGTYLTAGSQEPDLFVIDSTSKIYGSLSHSSTIHSWLNANVQDYRRAKQFIFDGERNNPVELGFNNWDCQKTYGDNIKAFMSIKAMDGFLANLGVTDLLYFGVNQYLQKGVVGIPDENYFRLPTVNSSSSSNISNTIFFDENGNLKYKWKNPTTNEYITKTISTD